MKLKLPWQIISCCCFSLLITYSAKAQHVLNGKVQDEKNGALPGATVKIKGTSRGVATDVDGAFMLEIASPDEVLQISFMGYKTLEETAGNRRTGTFTLAIDEEQAKLQEVTVVGFGTQKKVSVTGSIATVSVKNLQQAATPSLSNALAGRLPGIITRQASGEPGSDQAQVFIRGLGTWVNRSPLILVDGVERSMNNINAQEIESFSILKDASATAVYGVRGANGVIVINTKKGEKGRPRVTLRSETARLTPIRLPDYINAVEYAGLMNEGMNQVEQPARWSEEDIQKFRDGSDPYLYPNVDWADVIMRKHTYQTINNLSVTGGSEIVRYYANVGYTDQNGIWKNDPSNNYDTNERMKRYNYRSNVDINVAKELVLELGIGGIIQQGNFSSIGADALLDALRRTPPMAFTVRNPDGSPGGNPTSIGSNPWGLATQSGYSVHMHNTLQSTFSARWDLSGAVTPGLSVSGKFSYDYYSFAGINRHKQFAVKQYLGKDPVTGEDKYTVFREEQPLGYGVGNGSNRALYTEFITNYARSFGKHSVTGMVLYNQRDYVNINAGTSIDNLPFRRQGVAARAAYSYDDKYLVEFDMGYNGSENFPKGKRFGFFPSISAGWVPSGEQFWGENNVINNLKIRGSYGQVGNDQIGRRFLFLTTVNTRNAQGYAFGESQQFWPGIDELQIGTPNVTWEVATKANIGLDLGMFKNKLVLQIDAFAEDRDGILLQRGVMPDAAGFMPASIPFGNLGKAKNRGIDGMLEIKNNVANGLFYSFRANVTYARNTVVENDEPPQRYAYQSAKGHPIDQPFGLVGLGFFKDQAEIDKSPRQTFQDIVRPGDIKYEDVNGDGVVDNFDRVPIGFPRTPEFMYGFGGTVAYKNFDVSVFFNGAARASLYLNGPSIFPFLKGQGSYNVLREFYDNRWTKENPDGAKYPAVTDDLNVNNYRQSTVYMKDASYLRLRNAEIAYTLPVALTERAAISSLRIFINGLNLYTWDKIKVMDPESNDGVGSYPLQRSYNIGLQVNFK